MAEQRSRRRRSQPIVRGYLERISSRVFERYRDQITGLVGTHHGVYALYERETLYYIGLATDLKRRIRYHLRDRHKGKWTHFSLYIIGKEDQIREVESLLVRIANPTGNRVKGKLGKSTNLLPHLRTAVRGEISREIEELLGRPKRASGGARKQRKKALARPGTPPLGTLFPSGKVLYGRYKGKDYKAKVYRNGTIKVSGGLYRSPSTAAKAVTGMSLNGWRFWKYRDRASGKLRPINVLRK